MEFHPESTRIDTLVYEVRDCGASAGREEKSEIEY